MAQTTFFDDVNFDLKTMQDMFTGQPCFIQIHFREAQPDNSQAPHNQLPVCSCCSRSLHSMRKHGISLKCSLHGPNQLAILHWQIHHDSWLAAPSKILTVSVNTQHNKNAFCWRFFSQLQKCLNCLPCFHLEEFKQGHQRCPSSYLQRAVVRFFIAAVSLPCMIIVSLLHLLYSWIENCPTPLLF